ncbi:hypothetical protein T492DRAFT_21476 [Pavlovales sp. CCMP2436]|nr:hypothetical protein T492DRAFT_21476 [Pavlovales sp. CCMP2436]
MRAAALFYWRSMIWWARQRSYKTGAPPRPQPRSRNQNRVRHGTGSRYHAVQYGSLGNTSHAHYPQAQRLVLLLLSLTPSRVRALFRDHPPRVKRKASRGATGQMPAILNDTIKC